MTAPTPVAITVDGRAVAAREGQSVLEACRAAGARIPTLCHDPRIEPYGGCRLCIVEIEGMRGFPTSCTTKIAEGMSITTDNSTLRELRSTTIELLLSDHNTECLTCHQNGACSLQDLAYEFRVDGSRFAGERHSSAVVDDNPLIARDLSKCISCGRCVRICEEVQGASVWGYRGRGFDSVPDTPYGRPLTQSNCEFCGQCVSTCPVGALTDRLSQFTGRPWETESVRSTCGYCGVGCSIDYQTKDGHIVGASAPLDGGVNRGSLCAKGRYGWRFAHHPDRLTRPLVRGADGALTEASWEDALAFVADRLATVAAQEGPKAIGALASAKCTNEENFVLQRFVREVVGTPNVDHCARL